MFKFLFFVSFFLFTSAFAKISTLQCSYSNKSIPNVADLDLKIKRLTSDGYELASDPVISVTAQPRMNKPSGAVQTPESQYFYQSTICVTLTKP